MSEETPKTFKIPHVKVDAIFTIDISGAFLKKCQHLLFMLSQQMGEERINIAVEKFKNTDINACSVEEDTFFIMIALIREMEQQAQNQGKTEIKEIGPEELLAMQKEMTT